VPPSLACATDNAAYSPFLCLVEAVRNARRDISREAHLTTK